MTKAPLPASMLVARAEERKLERARIWAELKAAAEQKNRERRAQIEAEEREKSSK